MNFTQRLILQEHSGLNANPKSSSLELIASRSRVHKLNWFKDHKSQFISRLQRLEATYDYQEFNTFRK